MSSGLLQSRRGALPTCRSVWLDGGRYSIYDTSCEAGRCGHRWSKWRPSHRARVPRQKKEVRQFLGLGGFMPGFVWPGYSPASVGQCVVGMWRAVGSSGKASKADGAAVPFLPNQCHPFLVTPGQESVGVSWKAEQPWRTLVLLSREK